MKTVIKKFEELTLEEFYKIVKARIGVFVVEQNCPYPELDDLDRSSQHLYITDNDEIIAYLRIVPPGLRFKELSLGRILTVQSRRGTGLGMKLLLEGICAANREYGNCPIRISAQKYAVGFYEKVGFVQDSDEYFEDGIPHIEMIRDKQ